MSLYMSLLVNKNSMIINLNNNPLLMDLSTVYAVKVMGVVAKCTHILVNMLAINWFLWFLKINVHYTIMIYVNNRPNVQLF